MHETPLYGKRLKERLQALLDANSGKRRQSLAWFLAESFDVSRPQGHRILAALDQSISLDRLEWLCKEFDTTPDALLLEAAEDTMLVAATIEVAGRTYSCTAFIDRQPAALHGGLGAWKAAAGWCITSDREGLHPVRDIRINSLHASRLARVAILDDEYDAAESLMDIMNDDGFEATAFGTSSHLLNEVDAGIRFDVLILDWHLGRITGGEVIKKLKANTACPDHIVILSGVQQHYSSEITEAIQTNQAICLGKPVTSEILLATVKSRLANK